MEEVHLALWILRASKVVGQTSLRERDFNGTAPHEYQRWLKVKTLDQFLLLFRREEREELAIGRVLNSEQRTACREIFQSFVTDKVWPSVGALEIRLDEGQVDLARVLRDPLVRVSGAGNAASAYLTLYGLIALDEAQDDIAAVIRILRILGHRYASEMREANHSASTLIAEAGLDNEQAERVLMILSMQGAPFTVQNVGDPARRLIGTSRAFLGCRALTGIRSLAAWLAKTWPLGPPVAQNPATAIDALEPVGLRIFWTT